MTHLHFDSELHVSEPIQETFGFFADARNLERITPSWLEFRILTEVPARMQEGTLLRYRLRLHGIPFTWTSRITAWDPPWRFVDEQVQGPYRSWIHEHTFVPTPGGTLVRDHVSYRVLGGALVDRILVRPDLRRIFEYRRRRLRHLLEGRQPAHAGRELP